MPVLCAGLIGYFAFHLVQGDKGLFAYFSLTQQIERAEINLAEIQSERQKLEHRVALLSTEHLDLDLLEEQARLKLNVVHENDIVVFRSTLKK